MCCFAYFSGLGFVCGKFCEDYAAGSFASGVVMPDTNMLFADKPRESCIRKLMDIKLNNLFTVQVRHPIAFLSKIAAMQQWQNPVAPFLPIYRD